ncbi:MAG: hypothetical protein ACYC6B_09245 [Thermoleophilia bacterium]
MSTLTITDWGSIANLIMAAFTVMGVLASLYFSRKALREVQLDRRQRQSPHLAFERGGFRYPIKFVRAGKHIPGVNPKAVERLFPQLPDNAESVRIDEKHNKDGTVEIRNIGRLNNFGQGPALSTCVAWLPHRIWVGEEAFTLDKVKLEEPIYSNSLNTMPCDPGHIQPGDKSGLTRLPTFIEKDFEKKLTRVEGILLITSRDVFGQTHESRQEFTAFTGYKESSPWFHVTFGDLLVDQASA